MKSLGKRQKEIIMDFKVVSKILKERKLLVLKILMNKRSLKNHTWLWFRMDYGW